MLTKNRRRNDGKLKVTACALLISLAFGLQVYGRPEQGPQSGHLLVFPEKLSVGRLLTLEKTANLSTRHLAGKAYRDCRGTFTAAAELNLLLVANDNFTEHANILLKMPADSFVAATFEQTSMGDPQMAAVAHLTGLRYLDLDGTETSDQGLAKLSALTHLEYIDLAHTLFKGSGLAKFDAMQKLQFIDFGANDIDYKCIAPLTKLPLLHWVFAGKTGLQDQDMAALAGLKAVTHLALVDNRDLTDRGLKQLVVCKHLTWLDVRGTRVTSQGLLALKGLPLMNFKVSDAKVSAYDIDTIKKVFPGASVVIDGRATSVPTEVFAPLH